MKDRAIRRAETARIKQKRQFYWGRKGEMSARHLGIVASTAKPCSCWMCGNDRKYQGERTIQERRQMQDVDE